MMTIYIRYQWAEDRRGLFHAIPPEEKQDAEGASFTICGIMLKWAERRDEPVSTACETCLGLSTVKPVKYVDTSAVL